MSLDSFGRGGDVGGCALDAVEAALGRLRRRRAAHVQKPVYGIWPKQDMQPAKRRVDTASCNRIMLG